LLGIFGGGSDLLRAPSGLALALLDTLPFAKRAFARAMLHGLR